MQSDYVRYENLLKEGCPWVDLRQWGGLPNVKWCEETLCSWIAEPANTWSNLAFLVAAAVMWRWAKDEKQRSVRFFVPATIWVGSTSLGYHASVTFVTQVADFFGMYCYFLLLVLLNVVRMGKLPKEKLFVALWTGVVAFTAGTVVVAKVGLPVQGIVMVLLVAVLATEALAAPKSRPPEGYRYFALALLTIGVAAAFSASDASRAWCTPSNHVIQGHAIWHVLNGVGIALSYLYYRQFRAQLV